MTGLHLDHVRTLLARVREGQVAVADAEATYLGAADDEFLQELIGLRVAGMPAVLLAVLSFHRRSFPGIVHARESLAGYLTSPPRSGLPAPFVLGDGISVLLPRADEAIPSFLRALRAGRQVSSMVLDPGRIRVAFDFRGHNPSAVEAVRRAAGEPRTYVLRTVEGHVLSGRSPVTPGEDARFLALGDVVQYTPTGSYRLVDLMVNAGWIAAWADVTEEKPEVAARVWPPFLAGSATPELVLGLPADPALAIGGPEGAARAPATRRPSAGPVR